MKKLLALIILLGLLAFNISADGIAIKDDAYLLSESEKYQLEEKIESYKKLILSSIRQMNIMQVM